MKLKKETNSNLISKVKQMYFIYYYLLLLSLIAVTYYLCIIIRYSSFFPNVILI